MKTENPNVTTEITCPGRVAALHELHYDVGNRLTIAAHENSPDD